MGKSVESTMDTFIVIPPDGGWGWMVVLGSFFSYLIADGITYAFAIFLRDISESFECTKSQVAIAGALMSGFLCISGPIIAALVNRFGNRKIAIIGSFVACGSCMLSSITQSLYQLLITHGLMGGLGFAMVYMPAIIAVGFYFEKWRALATGISVCGAGIGGILFPPSFSILVDMIGWRNTFRIIAVLALACTICGLLFRPLKPVRIQVTDDKKLQGKWSYDTETISTVSMDEERKGFFNRFHNASYPTTADLQTKSTVILMQPRKLTKNTSSEFLMSATPLNTNTSPRDSYRSIKAIKTDASSYSTRYDNRLSTVYEESRGKCLFSMCCCCQHKQSDNSRSVFKKKNICYKCSFKCCNKNTSRYPEDTCCRKCCRKQGDEVTATRPLYRDDIFYSGSLMFVPEYRKSVLMAQSRGLTASLQSKSKSMLDYHMSVTRIATQKDLDEEGRCVLCPDSIKRTIATMLDFSLLKSKSFLLLSSNAILMSIGFYTPYMFITDRAIQMGIPEDTAFWFISTIGITNTLGRIVCGIISSFPKIKAIQVSYVSLIIAGIATAFSGLSFNVWVQFTYAGVYGFTIACMSTLRTIIIVELLGLEKLTNAVGIILMFQGIASLIGTALAGWLRDITGNYELSFYFAGGCILLGSFVLIPIPRISASEKNKTQNIDL